jgi:fumarate reductase subunit C
VNFGGRRVISERKQQAIDADDMRVPWWSQQDLEEIIMIDKATCLMVSLFSCLLLLVAVMPVVVL